MALTANPVWTKLEAHYAEVQELHMRTLFEEDPTRFEKFRSGSG